MHMTMKAVLALALAAPLQVFAADTVDWAHWSNVNNATLTQNGQLVHVTYTGDNAGLDLNAYIYDHPASFTNADVTNTPGSNGTIDMVGGKQTVNVIHFDHPVVNPYMDVFSVGRGGLPVSFVFLNADVSILSQGAGHWGGGTLTQSGNTITGQEGNGLLKLTGTYTEIDFQTPNLESYYGATVGVALTAPVPEPASWGMLLSGLGLLFIRGFLPGGFRKAPPPGRTG